MQRNLCVFVDCDYVQVNKSILKKYKAYFLIMRLVIFELNKCLKKTLT